MEGIKKLPFGSDFSEKVYQQTSEDSYKKIFAHLYEILPDAESELGRII